MFEDEFEMMCEQNDFELEDLFDELDEPEQPLY